MFWKISWCAASIVLKKREAQLLTHTCALALHAHLVEILSWNWPLRPCSTSWHLLTTFRVGAGAFISPALTHLCTDFVVFCSWWRRKHGSLGETFPDDLPTRLELAKLTWGKAGPTPTHMMGTANAAQNSSLLLIAQRAHWVQTSKIRIFRIQIVIISNNFLTTKCLGFLKKINGKILK